MGVLPKAMRTVKRIYVRKPCCLVELFHAGPSVSYRQALTRKRLTFHHWSDNVRNSTVSATRDVASRLPAKKTMPMPIKRSHNDSPKVRATLYLSADVLDQARDATVHLAGFPARLTLTKLAEDALWAELQRLKDRYNQGKDFPRRQEDLRGGRPIAA